MWTSESPNTQTTCSAFIAFNNHFQCLNYTTFTPFSQMLFCGQHVTIILCLQNVALQITTV